jgi:hypothetical protein
MSKLGVTPWDIVRVQPFDQGGLVDASTSLNSDGTIQTFVDENGDLLTARMMRNTESQKLILKQYLPSLYTGGMRKLMQVSHLRGEAGLVSAGHDLFLPDWADTYGVWVSSPVDGFCNRYIIRISSSGIFRYPIRFSQPLPADWQAIETAAEGLSAAEAAQTAGRMWSAGNFDPAQAVQIGDVPIMYSNGEGSFYPTCGWAFNSDGSSAVNTGVRIDPDDPMEARRRASLYRVDITESDGMPASASCVLVSSGELVNTFDDTDETRGPAIIQVADFASGERGFCKTLSCYPGLIGPRLFSTNTPVFAYYDSADALHLVSFTPSWDVSSSSSSTTESSARGSTEIFSDVFDGDNAGTAAYYASDPDWPFSASGYPSSVLAATWGSDSTTKSRTMRFSSSAVTPTNTSRTSSKADSSYETYGSLTAGSAYQLAPITIDWEVTQTDVESGTSSTYRDNRVFASDGGAQQRLQAAGIVSRTRSYNEEQRNHQVLILHGYDRTSYAVYTREINLQTSISLSYGGTNMAVPNPATLEYNGIHSGGSWVLHKLSSYFSESIVGTPPQHIVRDCVGTSKIPAGMIIYRPDNVNSISPPSGGAQADTSNVVLIGTVVIDRTAFELDLTGGDLEEVHIDSPVFYKAGRSLQDRSFYQERENLTPAKVVGIPGYSNTTGNVTAFVGWF